MPEPSNRRYQKIPRLLMMHNTNFTFEQYARRDTKDNEIVGVDIKALGIAVSRTKAEEWLGFRSRLGVNKTANIIGDV
jgi:hypothetical protein